VVEYPFIKGIEGFPEIIPVIKLEHETKNFGGIWHTDTAYLETPPMGTMLIAREVPPHGGDTLFANTYLAYETLSEGMKRMLDGLIAVNHSAKADVTRTREDRVRDGGKAEAIKEYISEHPGAHASGNRTQGALHQYRPHGAFQGYDRGRKCATAQFPV
jgi:taurine dioxygenase